MSSGLQTLFANLAEKEKIKGHHSPEGRAIRTLSRALSGWTAENLSDADVLVLCDQALEDWLKARLKLSAWSTRSLAELVAAAAAEGWITRAEAVELEQIRNARLRPHALADRSSTQSVEDALEFCIQLVEKHW